MGHEPVHDFWTCGYHCPSYICLLVHTKVERDLGAAVLSPMAKESIKQVQVYACLKETATINYDTEDEMMCQLIGDIAFTRVNTQLGFAEMYRFSVKFHIVQVPRFGGLGHAQAPLPKF